MRSVGNRLNGSQTPGSTAGQRQFLAAVSGALRSPDPRVRRGATRLFAAHFRELAQETALADDLLDLCDDPDPVVAMQAIKGLWRYWYWRADLELRGRIEDRLIAGLAKPGDPWVRRNLVEALYIIGDDNIRYLYQSWVPALATAESRARVTAAQHETVNRLGTKYAVVLKSGDRLQREGVLRAMSEFFERPVLGGRIGNDLEPMLFHGETIREVASALIKQLDDADPLIRRLALQALVTVRGGGTPPLALAVARRLGDDDADVRRWALTMTKEFPLKLNPGDRDPANLALIEHLLGRPGTEARAAALQYAGRLGPAAGPELAAKVRSALNDPAAAVRVAALAALASFNTLWSEPGVRDTIRRSMLDDDPLVRAAAIRLALEPRAQIAEPDLRLALDQLPPAAQIALLGQFMTEPALLNDLRVVSLISSALVHEHGGTREKALQLVQSRTALATNGAVENALREAQWIARQHGSPEGDREDAPRDARPIEWRDGSLRRAARRRILPIANPADFQSGWRRRPELRRMPSLAHDSQDDAPGQVGGVYVRGGSRQLPRGASGRESIEADR